ncbi:hypothetical protein BC940DRAFT_309786 [Gongronella butleri]|nr:hypothetical protein BC940DRAFT_309786 [Gongronella butleri]
MQLFFFLIPCWQWVFACMETIESLRGVAFAILFCALLRFLVTKGLTSTDVSRCFVRAWRRRMLSPFVCEKEAMVDNWQRAGVSSM